LVPALRHRRPERCRVPAIRLHASHPRRARYLIVIYYLIVPYHLA
jgi:hypothetical protein